MPVPSAITDLSTTPGSNYPTGSESPTLLDDYLRTYAAFIATLRDKYPSVADSAGTFTVSGALAYTSTLTGGTGVINIGSGQVYKDASGNVGVATTSPSGKLHVVGTTYLQGDVYINTSTAGIYSGSGAWPLKFGINGTEYARVDSSGNFVLTGSGVLGYGTGSGGTVTQATAKTNVVTLHKPAGRIIMNNAALAANTTVFFTLVNSVIGVDDTVAICIRGGMATSGTYQAWVDSVAAGTAVICLRNISGGSLSEAINLSFAVIKGATS